MKLDCIDVSKRFGSVTALDRLNLHLEDQRIHGLLGRNGAGKTTLLRMIGNLIQPSDCPLDEAKLSKLFFRTVFCLGKAV